MKILLFMKQIILIASIICLSSCGVLSDALKLHTISDAHKKESVEEIYKMKVNEILATTDKNNIEPLPKNYKQLIEQEVFGLKNYKCEEMRSFIQNAKNNALIELNQNNLKGLRKEYLKKEIERELEFTISLVKADYNRLCKNKKIIVYNNATQNLYNFSNPANSTVPLFKRCIDGIDIVNGSYIETLPSICFHKGEIIDF